MDGHQKLRVFETFEEHFSGVQLLKGAKCVKFWAIFETTAGEIVRIGVTREGCVDPDEPDGDLEDLESP